MMQVLEEPGSLIPRKNLIGGGDRFYLLRSGKCF